MRNPVDRRGWGWSKILCLTLGAVLLAIGPGAGASTEGPELWVSRYNGPGNGSDQAISVAPSPDGSKAYVTGWSRGNTSGYDYATVAYDSAGAQQWVGRYNGPGNGDDLPISLAASPDGSKVFVTGRSWGTTGGGGHGDRFDYATVAYNAAGAELWVSRYNGPGNAADYASFVAASPDGSRVFVTGRSVGIGSGFDYATVAYQASGAKLWVSRYNGPGNGPEEPHTLTVSPDGTQVFVTGVSVGASGFNEYATVAYDAATGAQLWAMRYEGRELGAVARDMTVSPDGSGLFVTGVVTISTQQPEGSCSGGTANYDWHTVAYNAATGTQRWVKRYGGPANGDDEPHTVAPSPDGTKVFVTGRRAGGPTCWDYVTMALDAATGTQLWRKVYDGPASGDDAAHAMAVSPNGSDVFVTGISWGGTSGHDYATLAYDAGTGTQQWVRRYNGLANGDENASSLAASPDGSRVFLTGGSWGGTTAFDYATVAYAA